MATMIDSTTIRSTYAIHGVDSDACKAWMASPITKAVIGQLDSCGILLALQFDDAALQSIVHLIVPCDVKQALIDRAKTKQTEQ